MKNLTQSILTLLLIFGLSASMHAGNYIESIEGDLSNNPVSPTVWDLDPGSNVLTASVVAGDLDYFTITIEDGEFLTGIYLTDYPIVDISFIALMDGPIFTEPPVGTNVTNLLGWYHLGPPLGDILPILATSPGAMGFTTPLGPGTYTFWYQQTGFTQTTATMSFMVQETAPIPTMSQWAVVIFGLIVLNLFAVALYQPGMSITRA